MITKEHIKDLRDQTGISIAQCKKALEDAGGDMEKALSELKKQGIAISQKKGDRTAGSGTIGVYVHGDGDMASMVVLRCETDFVAKNDEFKALAKDLAMQLVAMPAETPEELLAQEYIKNTDEKVSDLIQGMIQKFGENIYISHFSRHSISGR